MELEFELDVDEERRKRKQGEGREIYYSYKFNGTEEGIKATMVIKTEKDLRLGDGAIALVELTGVQTKVGGKKKK